MKVTLAVCVALLAVVLVQAEDEMGPPSLPAGSRVANGRPATPRQFPYMANIAAGSWYCAGSLITRSAVLTSAAFCVYYHATYTVRLGSIYRTGEDPSAWTVESIWAMMHPNFNKENEDNNIAIIHLPRLAPVNEFIQPVSLPSSPVVSTYVGRQAIVSGWGKTAPDSGYSDVLRWAEVLVIPNEYCKKFGASSLAVTDRQMCAGSFTTTLYGDHMGTPLVLYTRGQYMQIGVSSRRTSYEYNTSHPVIYTRVTPFIDWIKFNTESD